MLDKIEIVKPAEIEKRSMEIITSELNGRTWPEPEFSIVKRCIHTSADFDYADNLCFSENAAMLGVEALRRGAVIVTDTRMAWSGINKKKTGRVWRRGILLYVGCRCGTGSERQRLYSCSYLYGTWSSTGKRSNLCGWPCADSH